MSAYKKHQEKKVKELENKLKQKAGKEVSAEIKTTNENSYNCREFDFTTTSRQGLKIHRSKSHSKINFEQFPAACDICELVLESQKSPSRF